MFIDDDSYGHARIQVEEITRYSFENAYEDKFVVYDLGNDFVEAYSDEWKMFYIYGFKSLWTYERDDEKAKTIFLGSVRKIWTILNEQIEELTENAQKLKRVEQKIYDSEIVEKKKGE